MPQSNEPIKKRPKAEDHSTGDPDRVEERKGKPQEKDQSMSGKGSEKGGLNRNSGSSRPGGTEQG